LEVKIYALPVSVAEHLEKKESPQVLYRRRLNEPQSLSIHGAEERYFDFSSNQIAESSM
jgi:hypothetical protein